MPCKNFTVSEPKMTNPSIYPEKTQALDKSVLLMALDFRAVFRLTIKLNEQLND